MSSFEETGPSTPVTEGIRVDKVNPRSQLARKARAVIVVIVAIVLLIPVAIMLMTAFKSRADVVSAPPKLFFEPTVEGLVFLLTERSQLGNEALEEAKANAVTNRFVQLAMGLTHPSVGILIQLIVRSTR